MGDVTRILKAIDQGDPQAAEELLPVVYDELRRLAAHKLSHEKPGQTLQATALVHEAYLRLVGSEHQQWDGCGHFFAAAAEAMRRILVENSRHKNAQRHGGGLQRAPLDSSMLADDGPSIDLLALDEALSKLARERGAHAELVRLRFFAGLTGEQAAAVLGISVTTADRYWSYARSWLRVELAGGSSETDS